MVFEVTIASVGISTSTTTSSPTTELLIASATRSPNTHSTEEQFLPDSVVVFPVDPNTS